MLTDVEQEFDGMVGKVREKSILLNATTRQHIFLRKGIRLNASCKSVTCATLGAAILTLTLLNPAPAQPLPVPLAVGDSVVLLKAQASGVQVYTCKVVPPKDGVPTYAWVLRGPEAALSGSDGAPIGRHYAGPTWEAADGSKVVGMPLASAASPGNVPWLLLAAKSTSGKGRFSKVTYVERVFTSGGVAPRSADASQAGTEVRVPYTATYLFYGHP